MRFNQKIFVHCGMSKTGSTAMQKVLSENRQFLRIVSVIYPEPHTSQGNIRNVVSAIAQNDYSKARDHVREILDQSGFVAQRP